MDWNHLSRERDEEIRRELVQLFQKQIEGIDPSDFCVQAFALTGIGFENMLVDRLALLFIEIRRVRSRQFIENSFNRVADCRSSALSFLPVEN